MEIVDVIFLMSVAALVVLIYGTIKTIIRIKHVKNVALAKNEKFDATNPKALINAKEIVLLRHNIQMLGLHCSLLAFLIFMYWALNFG
ncbi:hypothetical protein [Buttiauxella gaviniae]|uniref:hypothetical protein n=1 Tax=Buttiauxella gaviniae TaxID=82990 RepID=UPI0039AF3B27